MKFFAAIAALVVAAVANAQTQPTWSNCATGSTDLTITTFSVTPYPLCIGQNVCASGTGTLSTPVVAGAKLAITGRYGGRVVYTDNQDLCSLTGGQGHPCPIPITVTSITVCLLVKTTAPANVPVALTVLATNGNGNVLFCQAATVTAKVC
ncbi:hypothetical protein BC939DRAFT_490711 [Gamsiella multidivaricata]|uniref:uncharacterized protein n=1 Tax=Gamsiella multidivaricata TaxID=101098 RepID=UPI00222070AF|nr:uncharacterized protein BC939DRAFT_490711 [Gamsiella multidivaricata]KAG0365869.1 hypothetical protein BGZ54_006110 [Gamsiella multidivaricata]KAI7828784.1 hypothetical protein BC939DRAFT_490711 [Gamsiella multidivaricata]